MSLKPNSIKVRAFLLIVLLLMVSTFSSFFLFGRTEHTPRALQTAQRVISVVKVARAALVSADQEWRAAFLDDLEESGVRIQMSKPNDAMEPLNEAAPDVERMVMEVRERLGKKTRFASSRNGVSGTWISFMVGKDEFWVALQESQAWQGHTEALIFWGLIILVLASAAGYWIASQVAKPLRNLAQAAQQLGLGLSPQKIQEQGPEEIINVAKSFNQMAENLLALEGERALVLAGISHDLRTPLTRARLSAEMSGDDSLRESLTLDIDQMDSIIQQFLDYARASQQEDLSVVDANVLAKEAAQPFLIRGHQITVKTDTDSFAFDRVAVRPLLLKRAISNLLDNAIKYGKEPIDVRIAVTPSRVVFEIQDHGPGIPLEQRESAKRPFVRLDAARSNVMGAGLGLAIVDRAARIHGGVFSLEPRIGGGLAAKLEFPNQVAEIKQD